MKAPLLRLRPLPVSRATYEKPYRIFLYDAQYMENCGLYVAVNLPDSIVVRENFS
jgi:hypothetical protein